MILAVRGYVQGLTKELKGVTEAGQQRVKLVGFRLTLELAEAFRLAVNVEVQANCKRKIG